MIEQPMIVTDVCVAWRGHDLSGCSGFLGPHDVDKAVHACSMS